MVALRGRMVRYIRGREPTVRTGLAVYRPELTNIAWLLLDRVLRVLGTFIVTVLAARLLGPASFGDLSFAQTIFAFLLLWVALGLQSVVVKHIVSAPGRAGDVLGAAFLAQCVAVFLTIAVTYGWILLPGGEQNRYEPLVLIMVLGLVLRPTETLRYWFESQVRVKYAVLADNIGFAVGLVLKLASLYVWRSAEVFAWAIAFEQIVAGLALLAVYRSYRGRPAKWHVQGRRVRSLVGESWPLLVAGIAIAIYTRVDQIVLMHFQGSQETGIFSAASRLSELFYMLPTVLATTLFPRLQRMHLNRTEDHFELISRIMAVLAAVSMAIALFATIFSGPIVNLIYGSSYASAAQVLSVHIWTVVFVSLGVFGNQWYLSHGLQRWTLLFTVLGAATNLIANILLVPRWGAPGAAVASLLAQLVSALLADAITKRTRPIFWAKLRALLSPATGAVWLFKKVFA